MLLPKFDSSLAAAPFIDNLKDTSKNGLNYQKLFDYLFFIKIHAVISILHFLTHFSLD
jgi:hypothetical protein